MHVFVLAAVPFVVTGVVVGLVVIVGMLTVMTAVILLWKKHSLKQRTEHSNQGMCDESSMNLCTDKDTC